MKALILLLSVLRVAFVGDPQVDNATELLYARRSIYSELRQRTDIDLVVVLGDLVNDNPSLLAASKASLDSLPCPWICSPGNHDKDFYRKTVRPRDLASFSSVLGYTDTCFVKGGVLFISLDNVRTVERASYEGGLSEKQKRWLSSCLEHSPEGQPIVLCGHIPFTEFEAPDSLKAIVSPYSSRMLMMAGHTHMVKRSTCLYGCEEVQAGASCGSWWRGVKDDAGVPYAIMNCGAPRGYFVAEFRPRVLDGGRSWYRLSYKCVGRDASDRASCAVIPASSDVKSAESKPARLLVNVYGGSPEARVEARIGGRWVVLQPSGDLAPEVQREIARTLAAGREYRKAHREEFIPLRRLHSSHVWAVDLPESKSAELSGKALRIRYREGNGLFRKHVCLKAHCINLDTVS